MKEKEYCPNCNSEIKNGFRANLLLHDKEAKFINYFLNKDAPAYCSHCGSGKLQEAQAIKMERLQSSLDFINVNLKIIPLVTIQHPPGWEYSAIGTVTAQMVMGTGIFTEFTSSWTDFFGKPASGYKQKIKEGEDACFQDLRVKCVKGGGDAVVGIDIDYSDLGSSKNLIMICVSGTIIKINNLETVIQGGNILNEVRCKYDEVVKIRSVDTNY